MSEILDANFNEKIYEKPRYKRINFAKFSSVKIGGEFDVEILGREYFEDLGGFFGDFCAKFETISGANLLTNLDAKLENPNANSCKFDGVIIGGANNILISPNPPKMGILSDEFNFIRVVKLDEIATKLREIQNEILDKFHQKNSENLAQNLTKFDKNRRILQIGARCKSSEIYRFTRENNIGGFEFLRGIPGTLGGLITMNAGLIQHEISQNLLSVITSNGEISRKNCGFAYRKSAINGVILGANFLINGEFDADLSDKIDEKRANQPRGASFGSCFKNPPNDSAGRLLQECGFRGKRLGGCGFSEKHANFLINYGSGSFDEAMRLIKSAQSAVKSRFGIDLQTEVVIL